MSEKLTNLPVVVQNKILSCLTVKEAQNLALTSKNVNDMVSSNRYFWLARARYLYSRDPALFIRLKEPTALPQNALVRHVSRGSCRFNQIECRIRADEYREDFIEMPDHVRSIAIDERNGRIAVYVEDFQLHVFSLLRYGDPAIAVIDAPPIDSMIIYNDIVFSRPPAIPVKYHADVLDWTTDTYLASLSPDIAATDKFPLKGSDNFIGTYHKIRNAVLAYALMGNEYECKPFFVDLPRDSTLTDFAFFGPRLHVIQTQLGDHDFVEYDVRTSNIQRKIPVARPSMLITPTLAYPFVLLNVTPKVMTEPAGEEVPAPLNILGARIYIPGSRPSPLMYNRLTAGGTIPNSASSSNFVFVSDLYGEQVLAAYINSRRFFPVPGCSPTSPHNVIASFGLSYVYARDSILVFRRFYNRNEVEIFLK